MQSKISETFGNRLRVRPCGILVENDKLLLIKHLSLGKEGIFWSPPGGGQRFGEPLVDCLKREFAEETGLQINVEGLMFVYEYLRHPLHALEIFFEVKSIGGTLRLGHDPELESESQIIQEMHFFNLQELNALPQAQLHPCLHRISHWNDLFQKTGFQDQT